MIDAAGLSNGEPRSAYRPCPLGRPGLGPDSPAHAPPARVTCTPTRRACAKTAGSTATEPSGCGCQVLGNSWEVNRALAKATSWQRATKKRVIVAWERLDCESKPVMTGLATWAVRTASTGWATWAQEPVIRTAPTHGIQGLSDNRQSKVCSAA